MPTTQTSSIGRRISDGPLVMRVAPVAVGPSESALRARFGVKGERPHDPAVLCGLLLYGYTRSLFSQRKLQRATYEDVAYRFVAGDPRPDDDALAHVRE